MGRGSMGHLLRKEHGYASGLNSPDVGLSAGLALSLRRGLCLLLPFNYFKLNSYYY